MIGGYIGKPIGGTLGASTPAAILGALSVTLGSFTQSSAGVLPVSAAASMQIAALAQSAAAELLILKPITDTDILQKPVNCVLAGEQTIKDRYRTWDVPQARRTERTSVRRSGVRPLGGRPSFTTKTGSRGYD